MCEGNKKICPECGGSKVSTGPCVCNMEWRGTKDGEDQGDDCQCAHEIACQLCGGTGSVPC